MERKVRALDDIQSIPNLLTIGIFSFLNSGFITPRTELFVLQNVLNLVSEDTRTTINEINDLGEELDQYEIESDCINISNRVLQEVDDATVHYNEVAMNVEDSLSYKLEPQNVPQLMAFTGFQYLSGPLSFGEYSMYFSKVYSANVPFHVLLDNTKEILDKRPHCHMANRILDGTTN